MIKKVISIFFNMIKTILVQLYKGISIKSFVFLALYIWTFSISFVFRKKFVEEIGFDIKKEGKIEKFIFIIIRNLTSMYIIIPIVKLLERFTLTGTIKKSLSDNLDLDSFGE